MTKIDIIIILLGFNTLIIVIYMGLGIYHIYRVRILTMKVATIFASLNEVLIHIHKMLSGGYYED